MDNSVLVAVAEGRAELLPDYSVPTEGNSLIQSKEQEWFCRGFLAGVSRIGINEIASIDEITKLGRQLIHECKFALKSCGSQPG